MRNVRILHRIKLFWHVFWYNLVCPSTDHRTCYTPKSDTFCACGKYHPKGKTWDQELETY